MKKIELKERSEISVREIWFGSVIIAAILVTNFLLEGKLDSLAILPIFIWIIFILRAPNTIKTPLNTIKHPLYVGVWR